MKKNKLLMIGVGMIVLYVLYKKFYATESEETAGAYGRRPMKTSNRGFFRPVQKAGIWLQCRCRDNSGRYKVTQCRASKYGDDCTACCGHHGQTSTNHEN
jgi:hypothetical protein